MINHDPVLFFAKYTAFTASLVILTFRVLKLHELGLCCVTMNIIVYVATLEKLLPVFREKNERYIDLNVLCMSTLNSGVWLSFAMIYGDIYLLIPNVIGITASVLNGVIYLWASGILPDCTCGLISKCLQQRNPDARSSESNKLIILK
jgi:hypothetical protein